MGTAAVYGIDAIIVGSDTAKNGGNVATCGGDDTAQIQAPVQTGRIGRGPWLCERQNTAAGTETSENAEQESKRATE
eukprot:3375977-Rhodomonas_salina.1